MDIVSSEFVNVKIEGGAIKVEVPLIALIKKAEAGTDNKILDAVLAILEKALS